MEVTAWIANGLNLESPSKELDEFYTYKMCKDDFDSITIPPIEPISKVPSNLRTSFDKASRFQNQHLPAFNVRQFPLHHMDPFMRAPDLDENIKLVNDSRNKVYKVEDKKLAQLDTATRRSFFGLARSRAISEALINKFQNPSSEEDRMILSALLTQKKDQYFISDHLASTSAGVTLLRRQVRR
ncbi:uncharacterized protein LOC124264719 [Haliotis rubra]|uniref:uncharacterized protein LOC124264719 n=1 Tax=Haliotis rubra TaxID=36100 RepID=UPI001EE553A5|nr:uncharacterized protein LOC124264719 [Haliotis rubra]